MKEKSKIIKGRKVTIVEKLKQNKGITLIALVITIIVLLILAGISIAMLTGENGILTQAQRSKEQTSIAEEKEQIALAYNAAIAKKQSTDITAKELDDELKANDAGADATEDGENIKVTFEESKREYIIDKNGNITKGGSGTVTPPTPDTGIGGTHYEKDTEVTVGEEIVVIPGGATVSKIPGEYEDVDEGFVIYITNDAEITEEDWQDAETMQKTYDQFVWVPVKEALAVDMDGNSTIDKTDIDLMVAAGRYPMAIKTSESPETYKGILYDFEEEGGAVKVTAKDYTTTRSYREPDVVSYDEGTYADEGITESSLQTEYNEMIKGVEKAGGFWVGRYETSKMSGDKSKDTSETEFIQVVKGTTEGINNVRWYRMYAQQKNYEKHLSKSNNVKSSMIWGSQWDQIMIWMKEEPNEVNTTNGGFYVTNSVGMGNFGAISGVEDGYDSLAATGCFDVRNIYDLAGNVYDRTLEANFTNGRVFRRRQLHQYQ